MSKTLTASPFAGRLLDETCTADQKLKRHIDAVRLMISMDLSYGLIQATRFYRPYFREISDAARRAVVEVAEKYGLDEAEVEMVVSVVTHLLGSDGQRIANWLPRPFRKKVRPCLAERVAVKKVDAAKWKKFFADPERRREAARMRRQRNGDPDD